MKRGGKGTRNDRTLLKEDKQRELSEWPWGAIFMDIPEDAVGEKFSVSGIAITRVTWGYCHIPLRFLDNFLPTTNLQAQVVGFLAGYL